MPVRMPGGHGLGVLPHHGQTRVQGGPQGHALIHVDRAFRREAEDLLQVGPHQRHPRAAADQQDGIDIRGLQAHLIQGHLHQHVGPRHQRR